MGTSTSGSTHLSRRTALALPAALAVGAAVAPGMARATGSVSRDALITLGTSAGPPPEVDRFGQSTALVVDGQTYLVDCGRGSVGQFARAGLTFQSLRAMFITHLHADHIADYYAFFLTAGFASSAVIAPGDGPFPPPPQPTVDAYGPGPAGGLPPSRVGYSTTTVGRPKITPGITDMTESLHRAYAYSSNIFNRDAGLRDIRELVRAHDIDVPRVGASYRSTAPAMQPFRVYADDKVTVSAVLVPHYDVYPSFAFRFDLASGKSVTFSGDTVKSDNVVTLAQDTDILIHEAVFTLGSAYMIRSHTSAVEVGEVAKEAGAKQVILSHYSPAGLPDAAWQEAIGKNYAGPVTVARDGQHFDL